MTLGRSLQGLCKLEMLEYHHKDESFTDLHREEQ